MSYFEHLAEQARSELARKEFEIEMLSKYYFWMQKLKIVETEIKTLVRPSSRLRNAFNMDKDQQEINRLCHDIEELFLSYYRTKLVRNEHFVDLKASYDLNRVSAYVLSIQNRVGAEEVCNVIVCV